MAGSIHIERRFHALSFFLLNLANPKLGKGTATKASTWYDYVISLHLPMNNWWKGMYISYRRGLTGVAYPPRKAMREPKRWDKQEQIPTSSRLYALERNTYCWKWEPNSKTHSTLMIHIGKQIRQKMEERKKTVVWLAKRLSCSRTNVYKIFDKYSVDTEILARISAILDFDFFSLYSDDVKKNQEEKDKH